MTSSTESAIGMLQRVHSHLLGGMASGSLMDSGLSRANSIRNLLIVQNNKTTPIALRAHQFQASPKFEQQRPMLCGQAVVWP